MKLNKDLKDAIYGAFGLIIGLPLLAAGFIAIVLAMMLALFGIPMLLLSTANHTLNIIGIAWGCLSMFGFFGYILVTIGE